LERKRGYDKKRAGKGETPKPKVDPGDVIAKVAGFAGPLCESEGLELVYVEFQREVAGWVLRVYVDKTGGVSLEDCSHVSRQLGDLLDVGIENVWPYNLEVSSPGENRPLGKLSDFEKFQGRMATIKLNTAIEGQKKFKGILQGVMDETIQLLMGDKTVTLPYKDIVKARLA